MSYIWEFSFLILKEYQLMSALGFKDRVDPLHVFFTYLILRFTSGVTPADCIEISMAAKPF